MATPEKSLVATEMFRFGSVSILAPKDAKKNVLAIRFDSLSTPKGSPVSMSVAALVKDAEAVSEAAPANVFKSLKRAVGGQIGTLFVGIDSRPATDTEPAETQAEMIQSEMTKLVEFCNRHKPATGSTTKLRVIETEVVKSLADAFLIKAGKSGQIPTAESMLEFCNLEMMEKARVAATTKAAKLLTDDLGQYRLQAAKKKDTAATETAATETAATETAATDEGEVETDEVEIEILAEDDSEVETDEVEDDSEVEETTV